MSRSSSKIIFLGALFFCAVFLFNLSKQGKITHTSLRKSWSLDFMRRGLQNDLPVLNIKIGTKSFNKIAEVVSKSKDKKILQDKDLYSAVIWDGKNGPELPVKLRLKGDWTDHINEEKKWSFRLQVEGNSAYRGMRHFSIQHPKTRNYLFEWLFIQKLRAEGILAPRYFFINVNVNGDDWGIYALEEAFSKELLENQRRRESVIMKYNETAAWEVRAADVNISDSSQFSDNAKIDTFQPQKLLTNDSLLNLFSSAKLKLEKLQQRELPAREVFDLPILAKYYAYTDLFRAHHGAYAWHNVRFYYDPISSLFEPIHFDGAAGTEMHGDLIAFGNGVFGSFYESLKHNLGFLQLYYREIKKLTDAKFLDSIFNEFGAELGHLEAVLGVEFPEVKLGREILYASRRVLNFYVEHIDPEFSLRAEYSPIIDSSRQIVFSVANYREFPMEIIAFELKTKRGNWSVLPIAKSDSEKFLDSGFYVVKGVKTGGQQKYTFLLDLPGQSLPRSEIKNQIRVKFRFLGDAKEVTVAATPLIDFKQSGVPRETDLQRLVSNNRCFALSSKKVLIVKAYQKCDILQDLVVPANVDFIVEEGAQLSFAENAALVIKSSIEVRGTKDHPVYMQPMPGGRWPGLFVIKAQKASDLHFLTIYGTKGVSRPGWLISGGVTFYQSDAGISDCNFGKNFSEDALNIVASSFNVLRSNFMETYGDAIDVDFGTGTITSSNFKNIGNDALDFSGSKVEVQDLNIETTGDKGLSVGEHSYVRASRLMIERANIGIASKDKSYAEVRQTSIVRSKSFDVAVYQKKPEFGAAEFFAEQLNADGRWQVGPGSMVKINGQQIHSNAKDVLEGDHVQ